MLHCFGDVPSPIAVGYLKDILAPGCVPDQGSDDDSIANSSACRSDDKGLRYTVLLVWLWLLWMTAFGILALILNFRKKLSTTEVP